MNKKRVVYDVLPTDGGWKVAKEGGQKASAKTETKVDAINVARDLAKGTSGPSQVRVHKKDGEIQTEWTYGNDPHNIPG